MDELIELEVKYSVDDFVRGFTFIQSRQLLSKYAFLIVPFILLVSILFVVLLNSKNSNQPLSKVILIVLVPTFSVFILFLLIKYLPNPFLKWNLRRQFKSSPILKEKQQISFDESGIKGRTDLSAGETKWKAIIEATETEDDFFFFTSNKFALFVPKRVFTLEQLIHIRDLAKRNLGDRAKF